jgi:hypothetical protein
MAYECYTKVPFGLKIGTREVDLARFHNKIYAGASFGHVRPLPIPQMNLTARLTGRFVLLYISNKIPRSGWLSCWFGEVIWELKIESFLRKAVGILKSRVFLKATRGISEKSEDVIFETTSGIT